MRDIRKIEENNLINISIFWLYKEKHPVCVSKKGFEEKHVDLLLTEEIHSFMYYIAEENIFSFCLQALSTEEILKSHARESFKICGKLIII